MSDLIWLMYLADLSSSLSVVLAFIGAITLLVAGITFIGRKIDESDVPAIVYKSAAVGAGFLLVACVLPSKAVVYAVIAQDISKEAIASERGQKVLKVIDKWLDEKAETKDKE